MDNIDQLLKLNTEVGALLQTLKIAPITEVETLLRKKVVEMFDLTLASSTTPSPVVEEPVVTEVETKVVEEIETAEDPAPIEETVDLPEDPVAEEAAPEEVEPEAPAEQPAEAPREEPIIPSAPESLNDVIKTEAVETIADAPQQMRLDEMISRQSASDFSKAFTINDKYRFIREIFDGSEVEFTDTVNLVTAMHSLDEAYEYFLEEQGWDPDNQAISDFLGIVANHFNAIG